MKDRMRFDVSSKKKVYIAFLILSLLLFLLCKAVAPTATNRRRGMVLKQNRDLHEKANVIIGTND